MIDILSSAEMAACDRRAIEEFGIPGLVLMENAGLQAVECILETLGEVPPETVILCGKGNNGGDGLVIARHLANAGSRVTVLLLAPAGSVTADAARNLEIVRAMEIEVRELPDTASWQEGAPALDDFDLVVDAILGTGLRDAARGVAALAIEAVCETEATVVAVDLPSGLDADSGEPPGVAVAADLTVTFAAPKSCHVLTPAADHCGDLAVVDISIPVAVLEDARPRLRLVEEADWETVCPRRWSTAHKGDHGRVLVIAGAVGTTGAAVLTAGGALRAGAGLVHLACPGAAWPAVAGAVAEALVHPVGEGTRLGDETLEELRTRIDAVDVVALGPGLGTDPATRRLVVDLVRSVERPMVIDADALNALDGDLSPVAAAAGPRVLTPHPGEAGRLLGIDTAAVQADRAAALEKLVEVSRSVVVLKGSRTLIGAPDAIPVVNPTGNPGMATGGSGDVLTGIIAALLAQRLEPFEAAWAGAWIHGRAGDMAASGAGQIGLVAGDLLDALPAAIGEPDGDEVGPDA